MPKFPRRSTATEHVRGSVFSALAHRLTTHHGEVYPLHVGDTWLEPAPGARMEDLALPDNPGMHRYSEPGGRSDLIEALIQRVYSRTGVEVEPANLFVTAGATAGLYATMVSLLEPGEEVLILAPYWPLIEGMVRACRAVPVPVPMLELDQKEELIARLDDLCSPRTALIYFSTPNNPTGRVLPSDWVGELVRWSSQRDLWIVADDVYELYVYNGEHTSAFPLAPERTIVAYSFSKAYGMAGNRCGYLLGPEDQMQEIRKIGVHTFYSTPTAGQLAALRALDLADDWLEETREAYRVVGNQVAERLDLNPPQGGTFLFVDVAQSLDERGLFGFLEDCADRGLFLAPGPSFGPYPHHVRLCFTAARPEITSRGAEVLAELLLQRRTTA